MSLPPGPLYGPGLSAPQWLSLLNPFPSAQSSQAQAQSICKFSLSFQPGPGQGLEPPEGRSPHVLDEPRPREAAVAAPSGPGWCQAVAAALNPQDRGLKRVVQETKGVYCLPHRGKDSPGQSWPQRVEPPPISSLALGCSLCPFMNSRLLEGRQHLGSVFGKRSGRKAALGLVPPWSGCVIKLPGERGPGTGRRN